MKSLKDIQQLSLQLIVASLRDAEQIQQVDLTSSIQWIREQKFPDIVIDMCKLGKRVETSLITGVSLDDPLLSKDGLGLEVFPRMDGSSLPSFCYSLFNQIFTESGLPRYILDVGRSRETQLVLLDSDRKVSPDWNVTKVASSAVLLLRQILLLFSKATDIDVQSSVEDEISAFVDRVTSQDRIRFRPGLSIVFSHARFLLHELLMPEGEIHPSLAQWVEEPFGLHGPGAVAYREKGREKWNFICDYMRLPSLLYSDAYGTPIGKKGRLDLFSRLCVVPKDFRGHRLICAEPKELQFAQQGLLKIFEQIISGSAVTNGHISLNDQTPSFYMSRSLKFGTIDLKDASDRVTLRLLKILLPEEVYKIVTRFRSDGVVLPDGTIIKQLSTAFTMGNALCFPIETLVFWALSLATILTMGGLLMPFSGYSTETIRKVPMRVFGDDIIVPIEWVTPVSETLAAAGLVVNTNKTCKRSLVRESCGSWWYAGFDCRITKLKYSSTVDLQMWTSFQDVIPQLRDNGLINLAGQMETFCQIVYPTKEMVSFFLRHGRLPELTFWCPPDSRTSERWYCFTIDDHRLFYRRNNDLQRVECRIPVRTADDTRAFAGHIGITAWYVQSASRFLNSSTQRTKFRWVALT